MMSKSWFVLCCLPVLLLWAGSAPAQIIDPAFAASYTYTDLGSAPGVPTNYGGLTLAPNNPNTLLIGGGANGGTGAIYSVGLTRDANHHINGFVGTAAYYAAAEYNDGGVMFGPGGVLFLARWPSNELGQVKPGSSSTDRVIYMGAFGVEHSLAALNFVPPGFPGAGRMKIVTYSGGQWSEVTLAPDGSGTFDVASVTPKLYLAGGPEGFAYVTAGSPQFPNPGLILSEYGANTVGVFDLDSNGDPIVLSRRTFMTGLSGAEGAYIDPLTGDFLFSTFGGGSRVLVVQGFNPAPRVVSAWRSVRMHSEGAYGITLDSTASGSGMTGPTVESRQGGIQRIEVDFDEPVTPGSAASISVVGRTVTGCPTCTAGPPVSYSVTSLVSNGSNGIAILFNPGALPDQTCYTITLGSGSLAQPTTGDNDCSVRALIGDTTGDGKVNLSDALLTFVKVGQPPSANPRYDINLQSPIDPYDIVAIKSLIASPARQAPCP